MKTVLIVPNWTKPETFPIGGKCAEKMESLGYEVFTPKNYFTTLGKYFGDAKVGPIDRKYDLMIVLGGDGSVLYSGVSAALSETPVVCINMGTVGFLTELDPTEIHRLEEIAEGEYALDERGLLHIDIEDDYGNIIYSSECINDVTLGKKDFAKSVMVDVSLDGDALFTFKGDGVVISTPTGSTAYSLSAGGPIIHPECDSISLTPVAPHAIRLRSVVFPSSGLIEIRCPMGDAVLSTDGKDTIPFKNQYVLKVTESAHKLSLIRIKGRSFYDIINEKLI